MKIFILLFLLLISYSSFSAKKYKFIETEITLKTETGDIFGTLMTPKKIKISPLAIIIAGSGPTDRNGNNPLGVNANSYKMLAEELAKNGISSIRYDKRGIAKSKDAAKSYGANMTFDVYVSDVVEWVNFIQKDSRFSSITLIGHSEGSMIGMMAAQKSKTTKYISIAGPGRSADVILKEQLKKQLKPEMNAEVIVAMDSLKAGNKIKKYPVELTNLFHPNIQPYLISWLKYDPAIEIRKLQIPTLIIQGTTDLQVTVEDAELLKAAKPTAELKIIEKMNHTLKESEADIQKNLATYSNPELKLHNEFMPIVISFIKN